MLLFFRFIDAIYFGFVPSFVDKAATVGEESAVDRIEDGKLSESLHGEEQHETDNHKADELDDNMISIANIATLVKVGVTYHTARATVAKRLTGRNEETGTNRTT